MADPKRPFRLNTIAKRTREDDTDGDRLALLGKLINLGMKLNFDLKPKLRPDQLFFSREEKDRMVEVVFEQPVHRLMKIPAAKAVATIAKLLPEHRKVRFHPEDRELWTKIKMEFPNRPPGRIFCDIAFIHLVEYYLPHQVAEMLLHPRTVLAKPATALLKGAHLGVLFTLAGLVRHVKGV